jgi:beta-galactosidase
MSRGTGGMWRPDRVLFGGDVNPDQWSDAVMAADVELMLAARVNTATVGVFAWSALEPEPGRFEFEWLDRAMDRFADAGIGVILATPTASPPPWFSRLHPEALPVTVDGVRLVHGSRDTYNPASEAYRAAARRITRALAERYGTHPALRMWHLHNEYGTVSFGPETDAAFRGWLMERYGSLGELNRIWHTAFWSQGYSDWDEIIAPQATQYLPNPTQMLDFRRFGSDMLLECLRDQLAIVREVTPEIPATTNLILPPWLHFDHWAFAREVDVISIDHYPDPADGAPEEQIAFASDLARSLASGRPWLLMEQATSLYFTADGRMLVREPGQLRRHTLQYLARGASGSLFFQWRSPVTGAEFFHSAMVPHSGPDSRLFREIADLGAELAALAPLAETPEDRVVDARVAIVWSADGWWASQTRGLPLAMDYLAQVREIHAATWRAGVVVDFVAPDGDLGDYDVVLVPPTLVLADADAERFATYARGGGILVVWYLSGTADEAFHIRAGGYSGGLAEIAGIRVEEHVPLPPGVSIPMSDGAAGSDWAEVVRLVDATAIVAHTGGAHALLAAEAPAVTRNEVGRGQVYYISVRSRGADLQQLVARILRDSGIDSAAPTGLEVVRRVAGDSSYLFAFNHTGETVAVDAIGVEVSSGEPVGPEVVLSPGEVRIVRDQRAGATTLGNTLGTSTNGLHPPDPVA